MADLTSHDDERAAEQARQKGQEEEKAKQRELELAKEKARKEGLDQEKAAEKARLEQENQKQKEIEKAKGDARKETLEQERARQKAKGGGGGLKIVLGIILLIIIIIAAAFLTLNVTVTNVAPGIAMPFTTNYGVSFPEGQTTTIGNTHIVVLSNQGLIITDIDGEKQNMVVGEKRVITERRAVITTLGVISLLDTHFEIDLVYKGERDNRAYFDMAVHTSRQVPDVLLRLLLPKEIDATPI
jgi:hypothetical protein